MASDRVDLEGNWYGMMVHCPSRGAIHVSFDGNSGSFQGKWEFPALTGGGARRGAFTATRFANWLFVRIRSKPLANVQCRLTIFNAEDPQNSMITGVIPLEGSAIPFATITLFRNETREMDGICPVIEFRPKELTR
ncbi:MAG: hypothetical protein P4L56_05065 [Candidatus Sulfopaludibacter sp.]|nr:hypothetical protein [Candidatus Sulfopaludibacter sp.]